MKNKKAFIITGASSSGNHLMTDILVNSGCVGTSSPDQTFEDDFKSGKDLLVWRGSQPKGGMGLWDIAGYIKRLECNGYKVKVVVVTRDMFCCASSIVYKYSFDNVNEAINDINKAYKHIYCNLKDFDDILTVSYESLVFRKKETLRWLSFVLGIKINPEINITNENDKWIKQI